VAAPIDPAPPAELVLDVAAVEGFDAGVLR
jgi:hypothetical protein